MEFGHATDRKTFYDVSGHAATLTAPCGDRYCVPYTPTRPENALGRVSSLLDPCELSQGIQLMTLEGRELSDAVEIDVG